MSFLKKLFLITEIFITIIEISIKLKFLKFTEIVTQLKKQKRYFNIDDKKLVRYIDRIFYFKIKNFHLFKPSCLKRALILYKLFHLNGRKVNINIGVKKSKNQIISHAYISKDGVPYFENLVNLKDLILICSK